MSETSNQAGVPVRGPACKRCPVLEAQVKRLRAEIERLAREHSFCEPAGRLLETELERLRDELATANRILTQAAPPSPEDIGMVPVTDISLSMAPDVISKAIADSKLWRFPDE